jgi:hypothetical protein
MFDIIIEYKTDKRTLKKWLAILSFCVHAKLPYLPNGNHVYVSMATGPYHTHPEIYNPVPIVSSHWSCSSTDSIAFTFQYCRYWIDSSVSTKTAILQSYSTVLGLY